MAFTLILGLCYGCQTTEQPPETYVPTEENLTPILQQIVEPQLEVYREALGLPDLQIEFQVTKFEVAYRTIEFRVRDLLVSEALTKEIDQAILNNSMDTQRLEALSDIRL